MKPLEIKKPKLVPLKDKENKKKEESGEDKGLQKEAFLYMEPKGDIKDFAQCSSCRMFIKDKNLCSLHGNNIKINPTDSCGLYVYGEAPKDEINHVEASTTPEESGLIRNTQARCENCEYFEDEDHDCLLFRLLNISDYKVKPKACCNAFSKD